MAVVPPSGATMIHTPRYHGPDRRGAERRHGVERRIQPRLGYGWWDNPDRRQASDRRRAP